MKKLLHILTYTFTCTLFAVFTAHVQAQPANHYEVPKTVSKITSDSDIISSLEGINKSTINLSKMGSQKSTNESVQRYAQQVLMDHQNAAKQLKDIQNKAQLGETTSADRRKLRQGSNDAIKRISNMDGNAFDQAFMDQQITRHQAAIQVIDKDLINKAENADLRNYITNLRAMMDSHLQTAKQIRSKL